MNLFEFAMVHAKYNYSANKSKTPKVVPSGHCHYSPKERSLKRGARYVFFKKYVKCYDSNAIIFNLELEMLFNFEFNEHGIL